MTTSKDTGPLVWNVPIVNKSGQPTPEFQRRWETQRQNNALIGTITFGTGAPTGSPEDGAEYVDTSVDPYILYVGSGGTWHQVGPKYLDDLADVNAPGAVQGDILFRGTTDWVILTPGSDGQVLTTHDTGADPSWEAATGGGAAGFGFNTSGTLAANELLGAGIIPNDVTFDQTDSRISVVCAVAPTADADFIIQSRDAFDNLIGPGTIHFTAGSLVGSLVLSPNPWLYVGGKPIYLYAPNPTDSTQLNVTGFIVGT